MSASPKETIRSRALDLGFDAVGFAAVGDFGRAGYLRRWLEDGRHGQMEWMARNAEKRDSMVRIMPEARSSVAVGLNYFSPGAAPGPGRGVVARYARASDYHRVMEKMLRSLSAAILETCGPETLCREYVDTGPLLERELSARAGIGWQGKSTVAISRKFGTWLLLGEILTSARFEPDEPARDLCGRCTRCIDACPTRAITGPRQLDAARCIAYLTIELKGPIPVPLRQAVGNRIFGCDDCLAVCPWNRFARQAHAFRDHQRPEMAALDARGILEMGEKDFEAAFSGTPIKRLGLRRLQRNAAVVLGNAGGRDVLDALARIRNGGDELLAEHAEWAIAQIERRTKG